MMGDARVTRAVSVRGSAESPSRWAGSVPNVVGPHNEQSARDELDDHGLPDPEGTGSGRTLRPKRGYPW